MKPAGETSENTKERLAAHGSHIAANGHVPHAFGVCMTEQCNTGLDLTTLSATCARGRDGMSDIGRQLKPYSSIVSLKPYSSIVSEGEE